MIRVFYPSSNVVHVPVTTAQVIILTFCGGDGGMGGPRGRKEGVTRSVEDNHQKLSIAVSNLLLITET